VKLRSVAAATIRYCGPAIEAAAQVIPAETRLHALFDARALGRERHGVTVVTDQSVHVGLGRCDAVGVGNGGHEVNHAPWIPR